jgi:hypothetical protein
MKTDPIFPLVLVLLAAAPVRADIAPQPEFGQSLASKTPTRVAMTEEEVTITLLPEKALVRAVFRLENTGEETALTVGFPDVVSGGPVVEPGVGPWSFPRLRDFRAPVDGKPVVHRWSRPEKAEDDRTDPPRIEEDGPDPVGNWIVWDMTFAAAAKRTVTVDYWVPYRHAYVPKLLGDRPFTYVLKTGAGWHGSIGKAVIDVRLAEGVTRKHLASIAPAGWRETEKGLRWELTDLEPTEDVVILVRRWASHDEAADAYLRAARKAVAERKLASEARALAAAAECLDLAGRREEGVAVCRRVIALERAAREGKPGHERLKRVTRTYRVPYEVWECRLVRGLVRLGRVEEARAEAPAAIAALRRYAEQANQWRYADVDEIPERIERYRRFAAGASFED